MKGDRGTLDKLHKAVTDVLLEELGKEEVNAAMLKVATGFLKDNNITCDTGDGDMDDLRDRLREKARRRLEAVPAVDGLQ